MFALSGEDLRKRILGCGDGPASFNCELTRRGGSVVSIDPLYRFSADEISRRVDETFDEVLRETRNNRNEFVWKHIGSVEELGRMRLESMRDFLSDYTQGRASGRYVPASAPDLGFADNSFGLSLCSHFLFLYSDHLDLPFHVSTLKELCRISAEARVFPLLQLGGEESPHLAPVLEHFRSQGYEVELIEVAYEFQRGGNRMLRIRKTGRSPRAAEIPASVD